MRIAAEALPAPCQPESCAPLSLQPPLQRWSASLLHTFLYTPAEPGAPAAAAAAVGAVPAPELRAAVGEACEPHEDRSLLTLVCAPGQTGLQVWLCCCFWPEAGHACLRGASRARRRHAAEWAACVPCLHGAERITFMSAATPRCYPPAGPQLLRRVAAGASAGRGRCAGDAGPCLGACPVWPAAGGLAPRGEWSILCPGNMPACHSPGHSRS